MTAPVTTLRLAVVDRPDADAVRKAVEGRPAVVLVGGLPGHALRRQAEARLARRTDLLVTGGGRPADGLLLLASLAVDVARAVPVALATHRDARRRGAVLAEVATHGRESDARVLLVTGDLTAQEWSTHERELRQRADALGLAVGSPTYVAAVDGRVGRAASFRVDGPAVEWLERLAPGVADVPLG